MCADLNAVEQDFLWTLRKFHDVLLLRQDDLLCAYQMRLRSLHSTVLHRLGMINLSFSRPDASLFGASDGVEKKSGDKPQGVKETRRSTGHERRCPTCERPTLSLRRTEMRRNCCLRMHKRSLRSSRHRILFTLMMMRKTLLYRKE